MTDQQENLAKLYKNIANVIVGKKESVILALVTLLCRGHLLIEDAPGLGKTMLARALAKSLNIDFKRVQCTPDLLPSDITGVSIYNQKSSVFEFIKGPVFTSIFLADEINRTTPRTQSSLLESMGEFQVTVDGKTYPLPDIFMVIATQNPIEYHGTFPLPEAQLDRFFMRISMGYPSLDDEVKIMQMQVDHHPIEDLKPVMLADSITQLQKAVANIHVEPSVHRYIAEIVKSTRDHADLSLGASPRGAIALMKAAQAMAMISGQNYVDPQFIKKVVVPVLAHRVKLKSQSQVTGKSAENILKSILEQVSVPLAAA
ncbi:MAG: MoxR family ATPase [Gammaproteobacteria bacterium]|nr:MoxR family ATPase [Gammaproteobacteria bacterium]